MQATANLRKAKEEIARTRGLIASGSDLYDRALVLPRLLPIGPRELHGSEPDLTRKICSLLARRLRAERNRGRSGHWTYDLNRHIALAQALRAERRSLLRGARPVASPPTRPRPLRKVDAGLSPGLL